MKLEAEERLAQLFGGVSDEEKMRFDADEITKDKEQESEEEKA